MSYHILGIPFILLKYNTTKKNSWESDFTCHTVCFLINNIRLGTLFDYFSLMFCLHWWKNKYVAIVNENSLFIIIGIYLI